MQRGAAQPDHGAPPMAGSRSGSPQDPLTNLFLGVLALGVALTALSTLTDEIRSFTAAIAILQLWPVSELAKSANWLFSIPYAGSWLFEPAAYWIDTVPLTQMADISPSDWRGLQLTAGRAAFAIYGLPMIMTVLGLRRIRPDLAFRSRHSLESLIGAQTKSWPLAGVVRSFEPLERRTNPVDAIASNRGGEPADFPANGRLLCCSDPAIAPPAMEIALRPEVWLASQGLAACAAKNDRQSSGPAQEQVRVRDELSVDAACEAMEAQLGKPWRGFNSLRPCFQALAAAFAMGLEDRTKDCEKLQESISRLAERSALGGRDLDASIQRSHRLARVVNIALEGSGGESLCRIADGHAWERSAIVAMLLAVRKKKGVLASASFVWLKREDRLLWYALNAAGNRVSAAEAAGIVSHFTAEMQAMQPLHTPCVHQGGKAAIEDYLELSPQRARLRRLTLEARKPIGQRLSEIAESSRSQHQRRKGC